MTTPLIFDIKRYAINDGPGIRITIFFKGCPLACRWCHNPEGISPQVEKLYTASKCIGAKNCIDVCPENALTLTPAGIKTDVDKCTLCGLCADACPSRAMEMSGRAYNTSQLMEIIRKEKVHMEHSGGGVTFSGGEPLLYPEFLYEMLSACEKEKIHTVVDTSGFADSEIILRIAEKTDLFLVDIKHMDPEVHKKWTGVSNRLILKNLELLAGNGANLNIRIPLIGNVNDDEKSLTEMAAYISRLPGKTPAINILPYHNIARGKHEKMGIDFDDSGIKETTAAIQHRAVEIFEKYKLFVEIGG